MVYTNHRKADKGFSRVSHQSEHRLKLLDALRKAAYSRVAARSLELASQRRINLRLYIR